MKKRMIGCMVVKMRANGKGILEVKGYSVMKVMILGNAGAEGERCRIMNMKRVRRYILKIRYTH